MLFRFNRFFYQQLKDIVEDHDTRSYRFRHWLDQAVALQLAIRVLFATICQYFSFDLWHYDISLYFFYLSHRNFFVSCMVIFILFSTFLSIVHRYLFFSCANTPTFLVLFEIGVRSPDTFDRYRKPEHEWRQLLDERYEKILCQPCRFRYIVPESIRRWYCWRRAQLESFFAMDHIKLDRVTFDTPAWYPQWTVEGHRLVTVILASLDRFYLWVHKNAFLPGISFCCILFYQIHQVIPLTVGFRFMQFMVELIVFIYYAFMVLQIFFLLFSIGVAITLSQIRFTEVLESRWKQASTICRKRVRRTLDNRANGGQVRIPVTTIAALAWAHRQHHQLCWIYCYSFKETWGAALAAYMSLSLPTNVVCVTSLWIPNLKFIDLMLLWALISCHITLTVVMMVSFAQQTTSIHRVKRYLVPVVQGIDIRRDFSLKLRYDNLYQRLTFGPPYGPSINCLGTITYEMVFQIGLTYAGMFIYVLGHFFLND